MGRPAVGRMFLVPWGTRVLPRCAPQRGYGLLPHREPSTPGSSLPGTPQAPLPSVPGRLRLLPTAPWRVPVLVLFRGGPFHLFKPGSPLGHVRAHVCVNCRHAGVGAWRPTCARTCPSSSSPRAARWNPAGLTHGHYVLLGTGVAATVVWAASRAVGCRCLPSALALRHLMFLKRLGGPSAVESPMSTVFRVWSIGSSQLTLGSRDCAHGQRPAGVLVKGS